MGVEGTMTGSTAIHGSLGIRTSTTQATGPRENVSGKGELNGRSVEVGPSPPPRQSGFVDMVMQQLGYFVGSLFHERTRQADSAVSVATVLSQKLELAVVADMDGGINRAVNIIDSDRLHEIRDAIAAHPRFFLDKGDETGGGIAGLNRRAAYKLMDHIDSVLDRQMAQSEDGTCGTFGLALAVKGIKLADVEGLGVPSEAALKKFLASYASALQALSAQFAIEDATFSTASARVGGDGEVIEQLKDHELLTLASGYATGGDRDSLFDASREVLAHAGGPGGVMVPVIRQHELEQSFTPDEIRAGLKSAPTIATLLRGETSAPSEPLPNALRRNLLWYNDRTEASAPFDDGRKPEVGRRIDQAWALIQTMVEPERLKAALAEKEPPSLIVHATGGYLGGLIGTRAYQDDRANEIHIAHNDPVDVIVHEFCHYLEVNLPLDALASTKHHLEDRAQGSRDLSNIFGPALTDERMYSEGSSAFGRYGHKYYRDATEVLSMGGEYLSNPRTARQLIENDPGLALMLLRVMRPQEYAAVLDGILSKRGGSESRSEGVSVSSMEESASRRSSISFVKVEDEAPLRQSGALARLPDRAVQADAVRLMDLARSRLSREPLGERSTPEPIKNGKSFYLEPQENASCARHAVNAFLGGPVANDESFTAVNMATRAERLLGGQDVLRTEVDSRQGNYPSQVKDYMDLLQDQGLGPEVVLHNIDLSGRAGGLDHELPDIAGDRAIVGTRLPSEHYVAFRKDEAGEWWMLDSLKEGPLQMSPQDYVAALENRNQQIALIVSER